MLKKLRTVLTISLCALFFSGMVSLKPLCAHAETNYDFNLAFCDNFDGDLNTGWYGLTGSKVFRGDSGYYEWDFGKNDTLVFNEDLAGDSNKMFVGSPVWDNCAVEVEYRASGQINFCIAFRASNTHLETDSFTGMVVSLNSTGVVIGYFDDAFAWHNVKNLNYPSGFVKEDIHTLKGVCVGDELTVYLDGEQHLNATFTGFQTGSVGMRNYSKGANLTGQVSVYSFVAHTLSEDFDGEISRATYEPVDYGREFYYSTPEMQKTPVPQENYNLDSRKGNDSAKKTWETVAIVSGVAFAALAAVATVLPIVQSKRRKAK